jgi:alkylation response protein AidB-like acyl-CoA dehydrogenase
VRLALTPEERRFRDGLRAWLEATLPTLPPPPPADDWPARRAYDTSWQRLLYEAGYAGITWPRQHGGRGGTPTEELIFLEETERAAAPYVGCNFVGTLHAGPTLIAAGSPEQQARHLPGILKGEHVWCQGFSEPEAGSDLASLRTKAVLEDDHYVVSGHKIWTSHAHVADFCELLVRTDPEAPAHRGITWLIMPMDSPGIEVRPIRTLLGVGEFNEMFLDGVRVPVANRVGAENDGWRVAMVTFSFERGTAFVSELLGARRMVGELARAARRLPRGPGSAWDDAAVRRQLAEVAAELDALWAFTRRNVSRASRGLDVALGGSAFKLAYHQARERMAAVATDLLGRAGLAMGDPLGLGGADHVEEGLYTLSLGIAAGTSEIQRNIVGERGLGLPKEPGARGGGG